jgi:hypothetical protein
MPGRDEKPEGYNDGEDLANIRQDETPRVMVDRMLTKTGPVEATIRSYCQNEGLDPDGPHSVLLALSGVLVAAMGRRAQRKFPISDPKELIEGEWDSALRAHNFVAEVVSRLGDVDDAYTKRMEKVKPGWGEVKLKVVARLGESGIRDLSTVSSVGEARRQVLLEEYEHLEVNTTKMALMVFLACHKYEVPRRLVSGLTETIMSKHYPHMPEYKPESVREVPLAYETKVLGLWRTLVKTLDD